MFFSFLVNLIFSAIFSNVDLHKEVGNFSLTHMFQSSEIKDLDGANEPSAKNLNPLNVELTAQSAASVDGKTGKILFNKNSEEIAPIASITKLMTAMVFLEHNPGWNKEITMEKCDEKNGDAPSIFRGETVTVRDLFYTSLVGSDNNATAALARSTGLSEDDFVAEMNKKASDFGLVNTKFVDPTGLNKENTSTALDLARLAHHAFQEADIVKVTSTPNYEIKIINSCATRKVYSTDKLLDTSLKIKAGKTGYIDEAGGCLVAQAENEKGNEIIAVVLGSKDKDTRFQEAEEIIKWTFDSYDW